MKEEKNNQIAIYSRGGTAPKLEVKLEKETVWLNQRQMSLFFAKDVKTINEHIKNIYKEGELKAKSTIRNFRIVQKRGVN